LLQIRSLLLFFSSPLLMMLAHAHPLLFLCFPFPPNSPASVFPQCRPIWPLPLLGLTKHELKGRRPLAKFLYNIKLIVMFPWYQGLVVSTTIQWWFVRIAFGGFNSIGLLGLKRPFLSFLIILCPVFFLSFMYHVVSSFSLVFIHLSLVSFLLASFCLTCSC
jgi:hypothetical protein